MLYFGKLPLNTRLELSGSVRILFSKSVSCTHVSFSAKTSNLKSVQLYFWIAWHDTPLHSDSIIMRLFAVTLEPQFLLHLLRVNIKLFRKSVTANRRDLQAIASVKKVKFFFFTFYINKKTHLDFVTGQRQTTSITEKEREKSHVVSYLTSAIYR